MVIFFPLEHWSQYLSHFYRHQFGEANPAHIRGLVELLEASDVDADMSALINLTFNLSVAPSIAASGLKFPDVPMKDEDDAATSFRSAFFDLSEKSDLVSIREVVSPAKFFVQRQKFSPQLVRLVQELERFWKENAAER